MDTSLICPCCTSYIYDLYRCDNNHSLCGDCWIKLKECPMCRNKKFCCANDQLAVLTSNVERKHCKNHRLNSDNSCNMLLYSFDDDHEVSCMFNPFKCKFCSSTFDEIETDKLVQHYTNNCVNTFRVLRYDMPDHEATEGQSFKVNDLELTPTLIVINDHYFVMVIPKGDKVSFIVFSVAQMYKYSDYVIEIKNFSNKTILSCNIVYKQFEANLIPLTSFNQLFGQKLSFTIKNRFVIKPKVTVQDINGVHIVEVSNVEGQPGSAGNWRKSDFDEIAEKFSGLLSKHGVK